MSERTPTHEPDATSAGPMWAIMMGTLGLVLVSSLCVWLVLNAQREPAPEPRFNATETTTDWPRLQQDPKRDLVAHQQKMSDRMNNSGWVNREEGIVHIPVEQAMQLIVERGLSEVGQ